MVGALPRGKHLTFRLWVAAAALLVSIWLGLASFQPGAGTLEVLVLRVSAVILPLHWAVDQMNLLSRLDLFTRQGRFLHRLGSRLFGAAPVFAVGAIDLLTFLLSDLPMMWRLSLLTSGLLALFPLLVMLGIAGAMAAYHRSRR